jgi:hypothetical protein
MDEEKIIGIESGKGKKKRGRPLRVEPPST